MQPINPLSASDLERINQALSLVAQADDMIRRLAACGENCQGHADTSAYLKQRLTAYKQQFLGGGP